MKSKVSAKDESKIEVMDAEPEALKSAKAKKLQKKDVNFIFESAYLHEDKIDTFRSALESKIMVKPDEFTLGADF